MSSMKLCCYRVAAKAIIAADMSDVGAGPSSEFDRTTGTEDIGEFALQKANIN